MTTTTTKVAEMIVAEGVVVPVRSGTSQQAKDGGPPSILRVCSTWIDTCNHMRKTQNERPGAHDGDDDQ